MADRMTLEQLHADIESLNTAATRKLLYIDESLIDRPETTRAYVERHHHWARLLDVVSSIPQLVNQQNAVPLVGFLGHFSSGKSSLINALLNIGRDEHPPFKRETGEHPTDKGITLTTHLRHFNIVRSQLSSGLANIAVVQGPALPMLEHMTLVDTPGLGDNPAEMELVTQFLHLVHVLVLPVHGRQPFADSEKAFALLNLAFKDLAGVPKVFVVTNADHFLNDRHGEFATDWNQAAADQFWQDTLTRLSGDSRFHAHREALTAAEPIFVDSIEGFQIDRLRDTLLPIVQDDAQRARTDAARTGYVFRCAAVALRHLASYISERSRHLAALRQQAEGRSNTTETAIEDLVKVLGPRLNSRSQSLPVDPQQLATLSDPLAQIVTAQTVQRSFDVNKYQLEIQQQLGSLALQRLNQIMRHAVAVYEQQRASAEVKFRSEVLTPGDVESAIKESGLQRAMKQCAQLAANAALMQYRHRLQVGIGVLNSSTDTFRVSDVLRDFKEELRSFERKHDDSVKGLFAYVTQPTSIDLLREHGFVTFDDAGKRRVDPESIAVFGLDEYKNIERALEGCTNALQAAQHLVAEGSDQPDGVDVPTGVDSVDEIIPRSAFASTDMSPILTHVTQQVVSAVSRFDDEVQAAIDNLLTTTRDREREQSERIQSIWVARRRVAGRFIGMALLLGGAAYLATRSSPDLLTALWKTVPETVWRDVLVNVVGSLVVLVIAGLITVGWTGFSNPAAREAFSSIVALRLRTWWLRHKQRRQLRKTVGDALRTLPSVLNQLDTACLTATTLWIQNECVEFRELHGRLTEARKRVNERAASITGLVTEVSPWVTTLPRRLLERSHTIREAAIAEHMATIREAAESVEALRFKIVRIAERAEASAP